MFLFTVNKLLEEGLSLTQPALSEASPMLYLQCCRCSVLLEEQTEHIAERDRERKSDESGLQAVVQLVQQWLSTNGKSKNLVVLLFMRLDISAGLQYTPEFQRSRL